jgi:uncharacterized protein YciI
MYVVLLNYTAPLEEVDAALPEHVAWLERNYEQGHFVASGRRDPRTGGVIIAHRMDRAKLDEILAGDPFGVKGLAEYEVVEFVASKTSPELAAFREAP